MRASVCAGEDARRREGGARCGPSASRPRAPSLSLPSTSQNESASTHHTHTTPCLLLYIQQRHPTKQSGGGGGHHRATMANALPRPAPGARTRRASGVWAGRWAVMPRCVQQKGEPRAVGELKNRGSRGKKGGRGSVQTRAKGGWGWVCCWTKCHEVGGRDN